MRRSLSVLLLPLLSSACAGEAELTPSDAGANVSTDASVPAVTYHRDIAPIIEGRCVSCHSPGNVGPFDLTGAEQVKALSAAIRGQVEARLMPPWHADDACRSYIGDRSLTDEQVDLIGAWVELGSPLGDPADVGAPLPPVQGGLTRVDRRVGPAEGYTPSGQDDYHCFVVEWPETTTQFVTGFNLEPSNPAVVHHANLYIIDPANADDYRGQDARAAGAGFPCFGGVFGDGAALLGAWAPGSTGIEFPAGTGIQVDPGMVVVMEMHFSTGPGRQGEDRSQIALQLEAEVERRAFIGPFWDFNRWSRGQMMIPAGQRDVMHAVDFDPEPYVPVLAPWLAGRAIRIWAAGLHMHYLGTSGKVYVRRDDGSDECVVEIPRWDFNWQYGYLLQEPVDFTIGLDTFYLECHWDNTAANQPTVNGSQRPPRDVNWGEDSEDEMCIGYVYITER